MHVGHKYQNVHINLKWIKTDLHVYQDCLVLRHLALNMYSKPNALILFATYRSLIVTMTCKSISIQSSLCRCVYMVLYMVSML